MRDRRRAAALLAATLLAAVAAPQLAHASTDDPSHGAPAQALIERQSLDDHGRRFLTDAVSADSARVYVGLRSAPDVASRADLAVRELERSGALTRRHLVIAVPTGSGWVDASALAGFERRFGGDVAVVAVQYSSAPSWVTFALDRDSARNTARALYHAVEQRVSQLPPEDRPSLFVYGQSLGALGAEAVDADAACAVLLAGPPGGSRTAGNVTVLANASDPVVHWSPRLLVAPPDLRDVRRDAPTPPWIPGVSFLQTTVDLLTALDSTPGHGHRYGTDQGTALPECGLDELSRQDGSH